MSFASTYNLPLQYGLSSKATTLRTWHQRQNPPMTQQHHSILLLFREVVLCTASVNGDSSLHYTFDLQLIQTLATRIKAAQYQLVRQKSLNLLNLGSRCPYRQSHFKSDRVISQARRVFLLISTHHYFYYTLRTVASRNIKPQASPFKQWAKPTTTPAPTAPETSTTQNPTMPKHAQSSYPKPCLVYSAMPPSRNASRSMQMVG